MEFEGSLIALYLFDVTEINHYIRENQEQRMAAGLVYIDNYDDAVADWNGKSNTEHIKQVGTDIELKDDEWIPSVAELYLIYLNKRSINAAIEFSGGSRIKDGWYWSSTERSATYAWTLYLDDGSLTGWATKVSNSGYVRAVAAFH